MGDNFSKGHGKIMKVADRIPATLNIDEIYGDRVLVKIEEGEKKSAGGIILPDSVIKQEFAVIGEVIAIGEQIDGDEPIKVKPGDRVVLGKYAGSAFLHEDGKEYLICRMYDISMKLKAKK